MNFLNSASLINFLGFAVGSALYVILLAMVIRHPNSRSHREETNRRGNSLLLLTAILGLSWNFISLFNLAWRDYLNSPFSPYLSAAAYTALGFLPAVVVNSEWRTAENEADANIKRLTVAAYFLSGLAAVLHFYCAVFLNFAPALTALWILTAGYLTILAALFILTRQTSVERKTIGATILAVFAVSALHLSYPHNEGEGAWLVELIGHQASIPFVFVILYQNFRFAFADLFLKRAFSLILLAAVVFGSYVLIAAPLAALHQTHSQPDVQGISITLILWMMTALSYPSLHRFAVWLVDKIILRRADYARLKKEIAQNLETREDVPAVLNHIRETLADVLTSKSSFVEEVDKTSPLTDSSLIEINKNETEILIPTADQPQYKVSLCDFAGGRRLLSEEIEMLEDVALQTARRIDALRVSHERCERELREQEFSSLATEAELRALRAQINPHFLFNALTTIGYLINAAPERALETLMRLTGLLRGVLRSVGEFQTLGEELKLIRAYLEIEQARFEERLKIEINVPDNFLSFQVPSLILQPLVENAVKHGVSPKKEGGVIRINARLDHRNFILRITDTGAGVDLAELSEKRKSRIGLNNIEQRLRLYFRDAAELTIESRAGFGTTVEIRIDLSVFESEQMYLPKARAEQRAFL